MSTFAAFFGGILVIWQSRHFKMIAIKNWPPCQQSYTRGPRWPCIARLITRQVSSQLAFVPEFNIDFQDDSHLGLPIRRFLAIFDLQVTSILSMSFESISLSVKEKKIKIDFQHGCHGGHLEFLIAMNLAILLSISDQILPIKLPFVCLCWGCLFVLRFYSQVNPMGSCRARSVYLTTRLLGMLSPLSG